MYNIGRVVKRCVGVLVFLSPAIIISVVVGRFLEFVCIAGIVVVVGAWIVGWAYLLMD